MLKSRPIGVAALLFFGQAAQYFGSTGNMVNVIAKIVAQSSLHLLMNSGGKAYGAHSVQWYGKQALHGEQSTAGDAGQVQIVRAAAAQQLSLGRE